jgi:hypothetical protein
VIPLGAVKYGAVAALLLALFAGGWHFGAGGVQAKWDKAIATQAAADADANRENRVIESRRQSNIIEAQNAATTRNKNLQVAAASAGAVAVSLRDEIATLRRSLPGLADDAVRQRADAVAAVLADCTDSYAGMAAAADRHASDVKTLMEAWPK